MPEPQSPFDEPAPWDEPAVLPEASSSGHRLPERKWSFVLLAVVLFALVWIRELTSMPPAVTLIVAALTLVCWLVVHVSFYVDLSHATVLMPHEAARAGGELAESRRAAAPPRKRRWGGIVGLLVGIWLPYLVPLSAFSLTVLVLLGVLGVVLSRLILRRR